MAIGIGRSNSVRLQGCEDPIADAPWKTQYSGKTYLTSNQPQKILGTINTKKKYDYCYCISL